MTTKRQTLTGLVLAAAIVLAGRAEAYTANKVWFEFHHGIFRVYVMYTVPELKEFRQAFVEFTKKKDAERFYWDLIKGADFFPSDPEKRRFVNPVAEPEPW